MSKTPRNVVVAFSDGNVSIFSLRTSPKPPRLSHSPQAQSLSDQVSALIKQALRGTRNARCFNDPALTQEAKEWELEAFATNPILTHASVVSWIVAVAIRVTLRSSASSSDEGEESKRDYVGIRLVGNSARAGLNLKENRLPGRWKCAGWKTVGQAGSSLKSSVFSPSNTPLPVFDNTG